MDLKGHFHPGAGYLDSHGNAADPALGASGHLGLGACVPPSFGVEQAATDPTAAEVAGLTFSDPTNTYSISAGTFTFYFVVETDVLTTLSAAITDTAASSISLDDASGVSEGDYLQIGPEVVLCGAPSGGDVPVRRAQLATAAATAVVGASVWTDQRQVTTARSEEHT